MPRSLRRILGDQLNRNHSWFKEVNDEVTYVIMETRSETGYVRHHIQKVVGFFLSMWVFAQELGSLLATKPHVASANYMHKSHSGKSSLGEGKY